MQCELPENLTDLIVLDPNGDRLFFDTKDELDQKLQNCNIQPIISLKGMEFNEDGTTFQPNFVVETIQIVSYVDKDNKE